MAEALPARRRDPDEKRRLLLDASRELFQERGFEATTTAAVARRAGVSEGIVFHHFGSKRGLLAAVAAEYGRGLAAAMFEGALHEIPEDGPDGMIRRAFAYVRENGAAFASATLAPDPADRDAATGPLRDEIVTALAESFEIGVRRGRLRPMSTRIVAELLFGLVNSAINECFVGGKGELEAVYRSEVVRCIEGAVAPHPTPDSNTPRRDP